MNRPCHRCRHPRHVHTHYRHGTDCSLCDCGRFTAPDWLLLLTWALLAASTVYVLVAVT